MEEGPDLRKRRQERSDAQQSEVVRKTNRLSVEMVRYLLWFTVGLQLVLAVLLFVWLWIRFDTPLPSLIVGIVITTGWVAWLRQVEFTRVYEPVQPTAPRARFRRPEPTQELEIPEEED